MEAPAAEIERRAAKTVEMLIQKGYHYFGAGGAYCMGLAQRGFAVVNFSYRPAPENKFPARPVFEGKEDAAAVDAPEKELFLNDLA